ncbi:MAG: RNA polymerase sigma factor [Frankiaceae bacterium]
MPGTGPVPVTTVPGHDSDDASDADLLRRLRAGDQDAFGGIVDAWSAAMMRVARGLVSTPASAEEVVQDTWLAVLRGLARFEGRSSLRTWSFRILVNTARTRAVRESRTVPWSSFAAAEGEGPAEDPSRFRAAGDEWAGWWSEAGRPQPWQSSPESGAVAAETRRLLAAALDDLPERQRVVVTLRDVEGFGSDEVRDLLGLSAANQRVLLHRGRARLRSTLEGYYRQGERPAP